MKRTPLLSLLLLVTLCTACGQKNNQDGHTLWFNSPRIGKATVCCPQETNATLDLAKKELADYWKGKQVLQLSLGTETYGKEGFCLQASQDTIYIKGAQPVGLLYGAYHLLRLQALGTSFTPGFTDSEQPDYALRILNHWDNLNGTIERGYAGHSLWQWDSLPEIRSARYEEYARANASIGINGTVLNNVNASPQMLAKSTLEKVKVLADIFRPYGLKVYLSVNFSSPAQLGKLPTSSPADSQVIGWWKEKVAEIYSLIPDFGGFLVKANSEGLPGPQDFGQTHADGANMLADALKPYGGIVMWRAFVYAANSKDRAKQACEEFIPLDGQFRDNVILQIKNGPVDFQPREPFSPLFGAMKQTALMPELQITQEYLGANVHMVYLHTMWKEFLDADTYLKGPGSTIAAITTGKVHPQALTAIAGVANIGDDANWCGYTMAQANWYAFGRMAWNSKLRPDEIADEWIEQTFTTDKAFVEPVKEMLLESHEAAVRYMMPLGLHHIFAGGHHYGPEPWYAPRGVRKDWLPGYYHQADSSGIGFDRSLTGTGAVSQYHEPWTSLLDNAQTCPDKYLLWFHHLPWDFVMKDGKTLWEDLCLTYQQGVDEARSFVTTWQSVKPYVDEQRFKEMETKLKRQAQDAVWWRDACLLYFQQFSNRPFPAGFEEPQYQLDSLKEYRLRISIHQAPPMDKLP